jgi:hypothetical protein
MKKLTLQMRNQEVAPMQRTQTQEKREMNTQNTGHWIKLARLLAISVGILFVAASSKASILTFEIDNTANNDSMQTSHPNYGDAVNSLTQTDGSFTNHYLQGNAFTPSINLSYSQTTGSSQNYYHDTQWPVGVDYLFTATSPGLPAQFFLTFTPTVGDIGVQVNSFRLFRYITGTETIDWKLHQATSSGTVFDSGSAVLTTSYPGVSISTAGQNYVGTVVLEISHLSGDPQGLGLDDVNFDQVPEPSSVLLACMGGLLLGRRRTR